MNRGKPSTFAFGYSQTGRSPPAGVTSVRTDHPLNAVCCRAADSSQLRDSVAAGRGAVVQIAEGQALDRPPGGVRVPECGVHRGEAGRLVLPQCTHALPPGEILQRLQLHQVGDERAGGELVVDAYVVELAVV